jgi:Peptidase C26
LRTEWPKDRTPLVRHRARGRVSSSTWVTHPVQLARPDSRLARAVKGRGELGRLTLDAVLSMHHQAVETLAPGLEVSALAPDGVIEALEETSPCRWWVGIQFHPEWSTQLHWVMGLFGAFLDASRTYSAIPREEIEPLRCEIRDWLRQRDESLCALHPWAATAASSADAPITPIPRRASLLTGSGRKSFVTPAGDL